ncbi:MULTISPECIES: hypothetical protein [Chryseobacterium]|uniref:hypothetical protein n=1 Tax=Chryseobacterium sp. R2A-55 TaxID=2744445 RepID=UPI001F22D7C3|nr:hypothetical protein [Chryseobacterium sp. R2A-55]
MFYLFFLIFILLGLAIFFSVFKAGNFGIFAKIFRIAVVVISVAVFAIYFVSRSLDSFLEDSMPLNVVNKLPIPLDFYVIKQNDSVKTNEKFVTIHLGNIRSNFYRTEHLDMKNADQYWIAGFMGKKNLVYFSQHSVPDDKTGQTLEVRNYLNQSVKLSEIAKSQISEAQLEAGKTSVWITMDLLLIFLNLGLLFRKK